ncbi:riboflavin transporter MCH5 [Diaporthe helianthi]|uniref:Riboflavin transporter MCH5 n=1 Tax=Diaporthe helianthi TaxID=158607 RepID=A0A2P5I0T3_DIAHE|nr:riboflavin transporter MCH5 [Diaporthe helianthi]
MTFDCPDAEDTCLKNHPYRHALSSAALTADECTPTVSGDLEKIDSRHHEDDDHIDVNREHRPHGGDLTTHQLEQGGHDTDDYDLSLSPSHRTLSTSAYPGRAPSTLPERVASRMSTSSSALTFPEGGAQGWLAVAGSFCAMLSVFGIINSSAVFESYFSEHQLAHHNASEIGWIFSIYLFCVFFVGIQVGPIFDRYGARWLVAVGSILIVLSLMLLGLCTEYYQILLTYSVMGGLGGALLNSPAYGTIAHFFNARRGFATGIATTAGGIGGIVFPIMLQKLLPRLGFAWSTRILGFILLGCAVPSNLWIRTRLPPRRQINKPIGQSSLRTKITSVLPDFRVFRDKRFALAAMGIFFMEWGLFIPITFIVSYAAAHGKDATNSYTLLSLLNAGSVAGRLLPGLMADRVGRFNVIIVTISLCCASVLGLWLPAGDSHAIIIAFAVVFGFASGSNLGLVPVCLGQLCDARDYARYISTANFLASFGTLSSVPVGGALLGDGGKDGWLALILFSGLSYCVALLCYVSARVLAVGWNLRTVF